MRSNEVRIIDIILKSSNEFYNDLKKDENGRYRSWEHCYTEFCNARKTNLVNIDFLCLHLSFYLASWGMYRGSSFLLQKDYLIHKPIVEEILNKKYDDLVGIECKDFYDEKNQKLLNELNTFMKNYYDNVRSSVIEHEIKSELSSTLITKILMGTLGCVPAYDRYFCAGIKRNNIATGNYNIKSILMLAKFYEENKKVLEELRKNMKVNEYIYPQMKLLDMGFWQIGFDLDTKK